MKKQLSVALAILLCLSPCADVMAVEVGPEPLYTYAEGTSVSLLANVNRLSIKTDGAYMLADLDGTPLTDAIYYSISDLSSYCGLLKVSSAEKTLSAQGDNQELLTEGVITADGAVVIPDDYMYTDVFNEHWGMAVRNLKKTDGSDYDISVIPFGGDSFKAIFTEIDIYNLDTGTVVATLSGDEYYTSSVKGEYINIVDDDENITGYNSSFEVMAENLNSPYDFSYASESDSEDTESENTAQPESFYDSEKGKYGIQTADGTVILPAEYDYTFVGSGGSGFPVVYYTLKRDDQESKGYMTADGQFIADAVYDDITITRINDNYACITVTQNDVKTSGLLNTSGDIIVPIEFDKITMYESDSYAVCEKGSEISIYSPVSGLVETDPITKDTDTVGHCDQAVLIEYATAEKTVIVSGDGSVTDMGSADVHYVDNTNGSIFRDSTDDTIIDSKGNILLEQCSGSNVSADGKYLLTRSADTGTYELFEIK